MKSTKTFKATVYVDGHEDNWYFCVKAELHNFIQRMVKQGYKVAVQEI